MASKAKCVRNRVSRTKSFKLKPLYAAMLPLLILGIPNNAVAASCAAGAITIANSSGGCDVDGVNAVTTVQFLNNSLSSDRLNLIGNSPSGAVTNVTNDDGNVTVSGVVTSQNTFGVGGGGRLESFTVNNGATFNLGHNVRASIGQIFGLVNHTAGTINISLAFQFHGTYVQSGAAAFTGNVTVFSAGSITLTTGGISGTINGLGGASRGALVFAGDFDIVSAIGGTNSLASITVNDSVTLTLDQNASATTFTVGTGTTGIVNQSAGTVTATNLNINDGAAHNLSGTGAIAATNIALGTGGSLNVNQTGNTTIAATISGAGSFTKTNTGTGSFFPAPMRIVVAQRSVAAYCKVRQLLYKATLPTLPMSPLTKRRLAPMPALSVARVVSLKPIPARSFFPARITIVVVPR